MALAATGAYIVNTALLDRSQGASPTPAPVSASASGASSVAISDPAPSRSASETPLDVTDSAIFGTTAAPEDGTGAGVVNSQVFELGRLGSVTVSRQGSVLTVAAIDSSWATEVVGSGSSVAVLFRSATEQFRFDIRTGETGMTGKLSTLPSTVTGPSGDSYGNSSREDESEREEREEEGESEQKEYEGEESEREND